MHRTIVVYMVALGLTAKTASDVPGTRAFQIIRHNVNNVELCVSNYGSFGRSEIGAGCWWPTGSGHGYIYGAGIWFGTIDSASFDTLVTIAYGPHGGECEFAPGLHGMAVDHPDAVIYQYPHPWPPFSATYPMAPQGPFSDQDSWCAYNDCDPAYHIAGDTRPIGIEVYQTVYAWNIPGLDDAVFLSFEIRNVTSEHLKKCYLSVTADIDIGNEAGFLANDWVSCIVGDWYFIGGDSLWVDDLAMVWQYVEEPDTPPWFPGIVGCDLLETPYDIVEGEDKDNDDILDQYERDSAYYVGTLPASMWDVDLDGVPDWRDPSQIPQLGLHAFKFFTLNLEPNLDRERYMTMAGYNFRLGTYCPFDPFPWGPDDVRFLLSTGPFDLLPDSSVTIAIGIVLADWHDIYVTPDTALIRVDHRAQLCYDLNWFVPGPAPAPGLTLVPGDAKVTLVWDNAPELHRDPWFDMVGLDPSSPIYDPYYREYDFEGYRVYKSTTGQVGTWNLLASCDLKNNFVFEDTLQPDSVRLRATDTGLFHLYTDEDVRNGFPYHYAVTSFDYNMVRTDSGAVVFPRPVWFESGKAGQSIVPRRDPANYVPAGEPVIEWLAGNSLLIELVSAVVAYPMAIDPAYPLYIEYLRQDTVTLLNTNTLGALVPYDGAKYTALLMDDQGVLDTIAYALAIGAGYVPHEIAPVRNGLLVRPDVGTPELPAGFAVFDAVRIVNGTYPSGFLVPSIVVPLPQASDSADTLYDRGIWAWRGSDYQVVWQRKHPSGPVNTVEVTDLATGEVIPYASFQNNSATRHLGAGWCFTWHGNLGTVWSKPSHDTLQTYPTFTGTQSTRYLYINGGVIALRNNSYMYDTIRPAEGETWIIRADPDYLPPSILGLVKITATPGVLLDTPVRLNVKVVPNPYIIVNEWQSRSIVRRVRFINLPARCTIRIFNLNGELVRTLKHSETSASGIVNDLGGDEWWNVLNDFHQLVASGVYIFHVESDVGEQVGKFVIID